MSPNATARVIAESAPVAHPFLKWAGGKTALLPEILARMPKKIESYYEPFLGGGAVFFALAAEGRFDEAELSDTNEELIKVYDSVKHRCEQLIRELKTYKTVPSEADFYAMRARNPRRMRPLAVAARMMYLNRTCFNGLYRVNGKGLFNVPFGKYKNPRICDAPNLRAVSAALQPAAIRALDFERAVEYATRGDAVYFDPPYVPVSETSNFTSYSKGGFGVDAQERLRNVAEKLVARGVHVLLSNADTPLVRELYVSFKIEKVRAPRRINSNGSKRGDVGEVLISGRDNDV